MLSIIAIDENIINGVIPLQFIVLKLNIVDDPIHDHVIIMIMVILRVHFLFDGEKKFREKHAYTARLRGGKRN